MSRFATIIGAFALVASSHPRAHAGLPGIPVPDPAHSSVPRCIVACPEGDIVTTIVVRDFFNAPVQGVVVYLDFSHCPDYTNCPPTSGSSTYFYDPATQRFYNRTDGTGTVRFPLRLVGNCMPDSVRVTTELPGPELGRAAFISVDQNGDFGVNTADEAIVQGRIGQSDWRSDLNCDGIISNNDVVIVSQHRDHLCRIATPTRRARWGTLKSIYR